MKARIMMFVQYEQNPTTGENLFFSEDVIRKGLIERWGSLNAWAYVSHDKDVYGEGDNIPDGKEVGDLRPKHWHVMLHFKNAVALSAVAKTFGIPENNIQVYRGKTAFLNGIEYLTHEHSAQKSLGKVEYSRSEVVFESAEVAEYWWKKLDEHQEKRLKNVPEKEQVNSLIKRLGSGEIDLKGARAEDLALFHRYETMFRRARKGYLENKPLPLSRANYYITGQGGAGKSVAAKAMARSLYPDLEDEDLFYVVGDGRVAFDKYDGQPVIIWDDWRSKDLLSKFDRGTVWKIFAVNPERVTQSIKYGEIVLSNTVNIVTAVQPFEEFIEGLAGEYVDSNKTRHAKEDAGQGYRRFPVFIEVTRSSLDFFLSNSLTGGEMREYQRVAKVDASMKQYAENVTSENTKRIMAPMVGLHQVIEENAGKNKKEVCEKIPVNVKYDEAFQDVLSSIGKDLPIIEGEFEEK